MTVEQLIAMLEDLDPESEVRLMTQKAWPFEYALQGVTSAEELTDFRPAGAPESPVVYLVEGEQLGYGTKDAWEVARQW